MTENESPPSPKGLSSEIGPALFPDASSVRAPIAAPGLLKSLLFGVQPPNSHSTLVSSRSFAKMDFVGGEEDAHDAWRDKYNAHRRASLDEGGTGTGASASASAGAKGGGGGGGGGVPINAHVAARDAGFGGRGALVVGSAPAGAGAGGFAAAGPVGPTLHDFGFRSRVFSSSVPGCKGGTGGGA
jgi:hypothetical protein